MKKFFNFFNIIFLILSSVLFLLIIIKIKKYLILSKFIKLFLLIFFFIYFSLGLFVKEFYKKKMSIIFLNTIFIVYSINLLLGLSVFKTVNQKERFKNFNLDYDERNILEFIKDEEKLGNEIFPYITPRELLNKIDDEDKLFLSGLSNKKYAQCKEQGFWKVIETDKFGFNNSNKLNNDYKILLIGDSFSDGTCSSKDKDLVSLLNSYALETYTIGFSGNGPLISLSALTEIKPHIKYNNIVWLFYRNDFYDLKWEFSDPRLKTYLNNSKPKFNFFENKEKFDEAYLNYYKSNINQNLEKGKAPTLWQSFWELKFIDKYYNIYINKNKINYDDSDLLLLSNIFKISKDQNQHLNNFLVIYLPSYSCFDNEYNNCNNEVDILKLATKSSNILVLDFMDYIRSQKIDYKKVFMLETPSNHYSDYGNLILSNFIKDNI